MSAVASPLERLKSHRLKEFSQGWNAMTTSGECTTICKRWLDLINRSDSTAKFYKVHTGFFTSSRRLKGPSASDRYSLAKPLIPDITGSKDPSALTMTELHGTEATPLVIIDLHGITSKSFITRKVITTSHAIAYSKSHSLIFDPNLGEWSTTDPGYNGDAVLSDLVGHYAPSSFTFTRMYQPGHQPQVDMGTATYDGGSGDDW